MEVLNQTHQQGGSTTMMQIQTGSSSSTSDRLLTVNNSTGMIEMSVTAPRFAHNNKILHQHSHSQQKYTPYKQQSMAKDHHHLQQQHGNLTTTSSSSSLFNDQESSINSSTCNEVIEVQQIPSPILLQSTPTTVTTTTSNNNVVSGGGGNNGVEQLSDFKVQELKHECKIRNLPVSGAKPQLIERLRPYQKEILDSKMQFDIFPQTPSEEVYNMSSSSSPKSNHSSTLVINNFLQHQKSEMQKNSQVVQLVDGSGKVLGLARVQYQAQKQLESPINLSPPTPTSSYNNNNSSQQFIQKTDNNIYRFSQLGSGGQFTLASDYSQEEPYNVQKQEDSRNMYVSPNPRIYTQQPQQQQQQKFEECRMLPPQQQMQQQVVHKHSMSLQDSPCAADQAGKSPNMPISEQMSSSSSYNTNNSNSNIGSSSSCQEIFNDETTRTSTTPPQQQQQPSTSSMIFDTQKLLSPKTLQIHEEMIREQQKQINEIMTLLGKNQKLLKEQQELILTAKKEQQKYKQKMNKLSVMDQKTVVKNSNDFRQLNRQHIQQFLAHKAQQQQLTEHTDEHNRLHKTETRLVEELHVGTAVEDIVRLIKQDARTALLIVSLLHKYRVERDQQHLSSPPQPKKVKEMSPPLTIPKKKQSVHNMNLNLTNTNISTTTHRKAQKRASTTPQPAPITPQQPRERENVDMEEIFKSVIEDASRSTSKTTSLLHHPQPAPQVQVQVQPQISQTPSPQEVVIQIEESPKIPQQQQHYEMQYDYDGGIQAQQVQPQIVIENGNMFENEAFPNIDEMVANMNENDDLKINLDSDELATILGDDWINTASRNINNHGQYDPQTPIEQQHRFDEQQNMDWLDQMIQNGSYE